MKPAQGKQFARPYLKNTQYKKGEHLPWKCEALSSNPSTTKKKKKFQIQLIRW
jgi:hypothetical protein